MGELADSIQQRVMDFFDREVKPLSEEDYRDLAENLAADFQDRYEVMVEEMEGNQ